MEAATIVRRIRALSGVSRKELAELADVSPSTISRIERGEMDPTWSTLSRILAATGYQISGNTVVSAGDTSAVVAARPWFDAILAAAAATSSSLTPALMTSAADLAVSALRDGSKFNQSTFWADTLKEIAFTLNPLSAVTNDWWQRWRRAGWLTDEADVNDLVTLAVSAGNAAKISRRNSIQRSVAAPEGWQALARTLGKADVNYAVSGLVAARDDRTNAESNLPVFYVDDPVGIAERFDLVTSSPGQGVLLIEARDGEVDDVEVEEGIRFVPRSRAILDALGGSGREPDKAENELRKLLTTA